MGGEGGLVPTIPHPPEVFDSSFTLIPAARIRANLLSVDSGGVFSGCGLGGDESGLSWVGFCSESVIVFSFRVVIFLNYALHHYNTKKLTKNRGGAMDKRRPARNSAMGIRSIAPFTIFRRRLGSPRPVLAISLSRFQFSNRP